MTQRNNGFYHCIAAGAGFFSVARFGAGSVLGGDPCAVGMICNPVGIAPIALVICIVTVRTLAHSIATGITLVVLHRAVPVIRFIVLGAADTFIPVGPFTHFPHSTVNMLRHRCFTDFDMRCIMLADALLLTLFRAGGCFCFGPCTIAMSGRIHHCGCTGQFLAAYRAVHHRIIRTCRFAACCDLIFRHRRSLSMVLAFNYFLLGQNQLTDRTFLTLGQAGFCAGSIHTGNGLFCMAGSTHGGFIMDRCIQQRFIKGADIHFQPLCFRAQIINICQLGAGTEGTAVHIR